MFSRRSGWDRSPNAVARALEERRASGARVLDLTVSNPSSAGLAWDDEQLRRLLDRPGAAAHRPEPLGLEEAREAVARWWRGRGVPARAEALVLTASTSEAYAYLFRLLCDPGDSVLVPRPSYPLFDDLAGLDALDVLSAPLRLEGERWRLDLEALADSLTERTRVVVVVHPNNPTGSRLDEREARGLARLCAERGAALISDEVFGELDWPGGGERGPRSLLGVAAEEGALVFALSGLSKAAGLPQLKLGWIAVDGPEALRREALARLEWIADTWLSVAAPVQLAAGALLEAGAAFRERCRARVGESLAAIDAALAGTGLRRLPGGAGWNAVLELPADLDEQALATGLVESAGVLVHPGAFYDLRPEGHLVLSLLTPPAELAEGLAALCRLALP